MYLILHTDLLEHNDIKKLLRTIVPVIFQEQSRIVLHIDETKYDYESLNLPNSESTTVSRNTVLNMLIRYSASNIPYIVLTSDVSLTNTFLNLGIRFIHCPINVNPDPYFDTAYKILEATKIPCIGFFKNPLQNAAGICPIIYHAGELFCCFGIEGYSSKMSDFGGGFDKVYTKHKREPYKNTILRNLQIKDGCIDPIILADHFTSFNDKELVSSLIMQQQLEIPFNSSSEYPMIGYGDPNTKYTAFRELMEETGFLDNDGNVGYTFDLNIVFKKLYQDNAYVYLGGDKKYGYDMFLVILTSDELTHEIRKGFLDLYVEYVHDKESYITQRLEGSVKHHRIKIPRNKEMIGMNIVPLSYIVQKTRNVSKKIFGDSLRGWESEESKIPGVYGNKYGAHILDNMRPCFASALVKYHEELASLEEYFNDMREILRIK